MYFQLLLHLKIKPKLKEIINNSAQKLVDWAHNSELRTDTPTPRITTWRLGADLTEAFWKWDILLNAAAPSVIFPLFTTNCDHYSTETPSDSIIAVAPVETSTFQSLLPESSPRRPLRSPQIYKHPEQRRQGSRQLKTREDWSAVFLFFRSRNQVWLQKRNGRDTCSLGER